MRLRIVRLNIMFHISIALKLLERILSIERDDNAIVFFFKRIIDALKSKAL